MFDEHPAFLRCPGCRCQRADRSTRETDSGDRKKCQAVLLVSRLIAFYGVLMSVFFHAVVVLLEEPICVPRQRVVHDEYSRRVPRWIGWKGAVQK